jgi:hypothetical protein
MHIAKSTLYRHWVWTSAVAAVVFMVLALLDLRLKTLAGYGTADLQGLAAPQLRVVFYTWSAAPNAAGAGFILGLDYLFMPLYATAFFYSGVITREAFAPRPGLLRRALALSAMVPLAGSLCDALENALQIWMFVSGTSDPLARLAATASEAKLLAFFIGLALFTAALVSRLAKPKKEPQSSNAAN